MPRDAQVAGVRGGVGAQDMAPGEERGEEGE